MTVEIMNEGLTKLLNFKAKKVEQLSLPHLKMTQRELNVQDEPVMGIHHADLWDNVIEQIEDVGLSYTVEPIYAGQNNDKFRPGVTVLNRAKEEYGDGSLQSHMLRRVIGRIQLNDFADNESNTAIGISYHQNGIQLAYGQNITVCQNMTIMGATNVASTYTAFQRERVGLDKLMSVLRDWLHNHESLRKEDLRKIKLLQEQEVKHDEVINMIGEMTELRVKSDKFNLKQMIPLNQGQISSFTEKYLKENVGDRKWNAYDILNLGTEMHTPLRTDMPLVYDRNLAMSQFLLNRYELV